MGLPRRGGGWMKQSLLRLAARLACVALVVSVVFPLGRMLFPYVGAEFGVLQFSALEAVLSTTIGFGIYTAFFGERRSSPASGPSAGAALRRGRTAWCAGRQAGAFLPRPHDRPPSRRPSAGGTRAVFEPRQGPGRDRRRPRHCQCRIGAQSI